MNLPGFSVEGKVTVITGASAGIGNTLARGFAAAGASVALVARSVAALEDTAREIVKAGGRAVAIPTDVTDGGQVASMAQKAVAEFGRIDVLVNCAGGTREHRFIPLLDMEEDVWDRIVDLNLKSVYLCSRAVGREMVRQHGGSIVNFSSGVAVHPVQGMAHYSGAKAGVNQLTRVLAVEWGRHNVRVNAISPGLIGTESERRWLSPELYKKYAQSTALGREGQPEDILGVVLFLASDAAAFISGDIIPVSGGPQ